MSTFKNKNSLRTIEAEISEKIKSNAEARPKFTGSFTKTEKACILYKVPFLNRATA